MVKYSNKGVLLLAGTFLVTLAFFGFNGRSGNELTHAQRADKKRAKTAELCGLVSNVLKKAEFLDGARGLSLSDSAEMAYALGDSRLIRENDQVRLYVSNEGFSKTPQVWLNIGEYTSRIQIEEEKLREYLR